MGIKTEYQCIITCDRCGDMWVNAYVPHRAKFLVQAQLNHIFNLDAKTTSEVIVKLEAHLDKLFQKEMAK